PVRSPRVVPVSRICFKRARYCFMSVDRRLRSGVLCPSVQSSIGPVACIRSGGGFFQMRPRVDAILLLRNAIRLELYQSGILSELVQENNDHALEIATLTMQQPTR